MDGPAVIGKTQVHSERTGISPSLQEEIQYNAFSDFWVASGGLFINILLAQMVRIESI